MNRARLGGLVMLDGVGLYLAGIVLPFYATPGPVIGIRGFGRVVEVSALHFGGPFNWVAATPLVLMFVTTIAALAAAARAGRAASIAGGVAAAIGAELLLAFMSSVVGALFMSHERARVGAVLAPLGAFAIVCGGLLAASTRHDDEPVGSRSVGPGLPSLLGGLGLFVAAYFTRTDNQFAAHISFNSDPLHWTHTSLWSALGCLLVVVVGVATLAAVLKGRPSLALVGAVAGFGAFAIIHFGDGIGFFLAAPIVNPGPGSYLGLVGGVLLLSSALILGSRFSRRSEVAAPSP